MVQLLFYRGHDATPEAAIGKALGQCAQVLMGNPSLVVQLENLNETGKSWDADIRVMALKAEDGEARRPARKRGGYNLDLNMKDPEHARSGNPNEWRPVGMRHDDPPVAYRFGNAAVAGTLPDIPLQEIMLPGYEMARASEPELKRILMELEQLRLRREEKLNADME